MAERLRTRITPAMVARYPRPGMSIPARVAYSPDSRTITYLASERGDLTFDRWSFDLKTVRGEGLVRPPAEGLDEAGLSVEERRRRARLRRREVGITEYWWSADAPVMLVP